MQEEQIEKDGIKDNDTNLDYIDAIAKMQKERVSKEEYEKVLQERKELINRLANGEYDQVQEESKPKDLKELRAFLKGDNQILNLDFAKKAIELRNELLARGEEDPFVPQGHNITASDNDRAMAKRLADGLQHCIDTADGNPDIFVNELTRITRDVRPIKK